MARARKTKMMGISLRRGLFGAAMLGLISASAPKAAGPSRVDGYVFLGTGYEFPDPDAYFKGNRLGAWAAWSLAYQGVETRLAAGSHYSRPYQDPDPAFGRKPRAWEVGLDEIWLRVPFDLFSWSFFAQGGSFLWCGNPDAVLSGGFLARSGSGSPLDLRQNRNWDALDSVAMLVPGLRLGARSPGRTWSHEAMILADTAGQVDLTPVYSFAFAPSAGFEAGGTVEYYRGIPMGEPEIYRASDTTFATLDARVFSISARMAVDIRALLRGGAAADRAGRIYLEAALHGPRELPEYIREHREPLHLMAGLHLPGFGFLQDFRLQCERTPVDLEYYYRDEPWFRPSYIHIGYSDYYWYGQAYAAKDFLPWLSLQGWLVMSLGTEGDHVPDEAVNSYSSNRLFLMEGRLVARF